MASPTSPARLERKGHRFRTRTDTEVIVHLYEEAGEDFVDHLRGEFAIALLDERKGLLYLVRDRFGIKPLFYAELPGSIVFGSEIKALFQFPQLPRTLNRHHLFHTLHGLLVPGQTYFEGVRDLEPGCMLTVSPAGASRRRYWDLPFVQQDRASVDEAEGVEEYRRLLHESVRLRLHGDVEAGVFLSGGIDSTAIASVMSEMTDRPPKAFTIAFEKEGFDESGPAVEFARERQFEHHVVRVGRAALAPAFERSIWHGEIAVGNSHGVAKLLLSELAHRHVKVVLTGEGADESLAGYNVFRHLLLLEALRERPGDRQARQDLDALIASLGMYSGILPIRAYPEYERMTRLFGSYPYAMARALRLATAARRILSRDFLTAVAGVDPAEEMAARLGIGRLSGLGPVSAHQYHGFKTDLAGYILVCLGDRAEMANSLEGRLPFLDHKLVEFACTLPVGLKVRHDTTKYILRQAMKARVPAAAARQETPIHGAVRRDARLRSWLRAAGPVSGSATVKKVGIFQPLAIAALRQSLRILPTRSHAHSMAETLLTLVASTHALHELFCERFEESAGRFSSTLDERPALAQALVGDRAMDLLLFVLQVIFMVPMILRVARRERPDTTLLTSSPRACRRQVCCARNRPAHRVDWFRRAVLDDRDRTRDHVAGRCQRRLAHCGHRADVLVLRRPALLAPAPDDRVWTRVLRERTVSAIRHPIYLAFDLLGVGLAVAVPTPMVIAGAVLLIVGGDLRARAEERALVEAFGNRYQEYARHVARRIPGVH